MELVPAIDLRGGRAVRLHQGAFDRETPARETPIELCRRFAGAGARRLHVVDLDGARDGVAANRAVLRSLAAAGALRLQAGGGLRTHADVERMLADGVERAVAGSVAVESPDAIADWLARFGADRIVAALDVRIAPDGTPRLATHGWQRESAATLWDHAERLTALGVRHVLCTDIARDGALAGPNLALYAECVRRFPGLCWQASGGVRDGADLAALAGTGVAAAISGRALIEERLSPEEIAPFLPAA
jgi:phosphoribosylformimino-5-aminoimidazole carboxamide ribotide isomerase